MKALFGEEEIKTRTNEIAREIMRDFPNGDFVFLGVLKSAFIFMADLVRSIDADVALDFIRVASYHSGTESSGSVKISRDVEMDIEGRDVVVVEDILDSGLTLNFLKKWLSAKRPRSLKFCVLVDKKKRRKEPFNADYIGFSIDDGFIVGYGLDCNESHRNLPGIFIFDGEVKDHDCSM